MNSSPLKVVAVSDETLRSELFDALLVDDSDSDIIVVESIPRAYSRIRELEPERRCRSRAGQFLASCDCAIERQLC